MALFQLYSPLDGIESGLRRWALAAAVTVVVAALAGLVAQTAAMAGSLAAALDPVALDLVVRNTALGQAHLARAILALSAVLLLLAPVPWRLTAGIVALLGLGVCASFAWSGHAGATPGAWGVAHITSDVIHVTAAGAWLGAISVFLLASRDGASVSRPDLHRALSGFAGVGTVAVAVLVLSGGVNAFVLIGPAAAATALETPYGRWLALKLGLFVAMLGLAALNRFRLTPALDATVDAGSILARLRTSLRVEAGLGAAVLAVVAIMGVLAPPSAL